MKFAEEGAFGLQHYAVRKTWRVGCVRPVDDFVTAFDEGVEDIFAEGKSLFDGFILVVAHHQFGGGGSNGQNQTQRGGESFEIGCGFDNPLVGQVHFVDSARIAFFVEDK